MSTPIHQEILFGANPDRVYDALTRSEQFSSVTDAPADISRDAGGVFSCFGGKITGRNIELSPGKRVVQAWRAGNWPDGVYSIVRFELVGEGSETRLVFDHDAFPADQREHLESGWHRMYWEPLRKYLAGRAA